METLVSGLTRLCLLLLAPTREAAPWPRLQELCRQRDMALAPASPGGVQAALVCATTGALSESPSAEEVGLRSKLLRAASTPRVQDRSCRLILVRADLDGCFQAAP